MIHVDSKTFLKFILILVHPTCGLQLLGCFVDGQNDVRVLNEASYESTANSEKLCVSFCYSQATVYAGVEGV